MSKIIMALLMSSFLMISMANAQPKGGIIMAADELGLTEDQMDKLADLRFEHQKEMIKKRAALDEARLGLRRVMRKAEVDKKAALSEQEKISAIEADMARIMLDHRLQMRTVLSSEQLDKWMKMRREHGSRGGMDNKGKCGHAGMEPRQGRISGKDMGPGPGHDFWD